MAKAPRKRPSGKQGAAGRAGARAAPRGSKTGGPQERALVDVAHVLDGLDRPSAVIGGIAVIAWGYARFTADIDCAVAASSLESKEVLRHFERGGFEPRMDDAIEFAEQNLALGLKADSGQIESTLADFDALLDTDRLSDWRRLKRNR